MIEYLVLGLIQGFAEWLPVSSEGLIVLARTHIFGRTGLLDAIEIALFLHLGTFFAAFFYFRTEVMSLIKDFLSFAIQEDERKRELEFYVVATLISLGLGGGLYFLIGEAESLFEITGKIITIIIGGLLVVTGLLLASRKEVGKRKVGEAQFDDGVLTGLIQGLAVLPGVSRSGSTVSVLLLRKFDEVEALKMSFILSLPMVLVGNILLALGSFDISFANFVGLIAAFVAGYVTINVFLKVAKKVDFSTFVLGFGLLVLVSALF